MTIIPDMTRTLEPGTCCLNTSLREDERPSEEKMDLEGLNVLLWRSPCYNEREIRPYKVAMFDPSRFQEESSGDSRRTKEWFKWASGLKNVLILPTAEALEYSAAHEMGGADHDGDKVVVCWDQRIVDKAWQSLSGQPPVIIKPDESYEQDLDTPHPGALPIRPLMLERSSEMVAMTKALQDFTVRASTICVCRFLVS